MEDTQLIENTTESLIKDLESMAFIIDNIGDKAVLQMLNGSLFDEAASTIKNLVKQNNNLKLEVDHYKKKLNEISTK